MFVGSGRTVSQVPGIPVHEAILVFSTNLHHPLDLTTNKPPHFCRHYVELSPHHHRHHLLVIQLPTYLQQCLESVRKTHKERPSPPSACHRARRLQFSQPNSRHPSPAGTGT